MADIVQAPGLKVDLEGSTMTRAVSARCTFSFDTRIAEAEVTYTSGESLSPTYWDQVEIYADANTRPATTLRFRGNVLFFDNSFWPAQVTMHCKGQLYAAEFTKNPNDGGSDMSNAAAGQTDEDQVRSVLTTCGVPYVSGNIDGTGQLLGTDAFSGSGFVSPFTWLQGESGLSYIERLDEISVPDAANGKYRTFETLAGDVYRIKINPNPETAAADFTFTEGVDLLDARVRHDISTVANKVRVVGFDDGLLNAADLPGAEEWTESEASPYLPAGTDAAYELSSPMIERSTIAQSGNGIACQAVAIFEVTARDVETVEVDFTTYRGDLLGPGQVIQLTAPTVLGVNQKLWLRSLTVEVTAQGAFHQHVGLVVGN